jgi:hypothetical protein
MKLRSFLIPAACLHLLVFCAVSSRSQTVVTFDDISNVGNSAVITNGYQGLNWTNFWVLNAFTQTSTYGLSGYYYGMVTASNVAYDGFGNPAEIDSPGTNFDFLGAHFTGAWNSNLNIEVQGFRGTNLVYDETKVVSATSPTLCTFDYLDIDHLYFNSYGGEPAFGGTSRASFVMDNFMFEFIPEPSTFLLAALAAVSLAAVLRRQRA